MSRRCLEPQDRPAFMALQEALLTLYPYPIGGNPSLLFDSPGSRSLAVFSAQTELMGYIVWAEIPGVCEILDLAVHPQWQRQGVMGQLWRAALELMPPGCDLWLEVHEGNLAALSFYQKLGFSVEGRRDRYYRDGGAALVLTYLG